MYRNTQEATMKHLHVAYRELIWWPC